MLYLSSFTFPPLEVEEGFLNDVRLTCHDTFYPFGVLGAKGVGRLEFEPFTVLYGGNGCGKTTVLNVIAEKVGLKRESDFNKSVFLRDYLKFCDFRMRRKPLREGRIITSDDVFEHILNVRRVNGEVDERREEVFERYTENRRGGYRLESLDDYEKLRDVNSSRRLSKSEYARRNVAGNVREFSNGENALSYFSEKVRQDALYLLDEPENSLSAENQLKLARFLEDSYRFYNCQFIISTHSPFLLSVKGAEVYDMEGEPFGVKKWTDLKNVRLFHDFFMEHADEF